MILKNKMSTSQDCKPKIVSSLSYDYISQDCDLMKHFVGLTPKHFEVLYGFLSDICPLEKINYWNFKESADSEKSTKGPELMLSCREKLFITLVWLRRGFTLKTLAVLLSSPDRKIEQTQVRKIFTTYIQLMFRVFRDMETMVVVAACLVNFQGTICNRNIKEPGIFADRLDFVSFKIIFFCMFKEAHKENYFIASIIYYKWRGNLMVSALCNPIEWSGFEAWPGSLCCVLGQDTLLS